MQKIFFNYFSHHSIRIHVQAEGLVTTLASMVRSASSTARRSDAASSEIKETNTKLEAAVEQHCLVDSDDEGLLSAEELEWALAQRSTDPFIKQRVQKGKFMVSILFQHFLLIDAQQRSTACATQET